MWCGWTPTPSRNTRGSTATVACSGCWRRTTADPDGRLDGHAGDRLKEVFKQRPPHTVSQAIERIEQETGVRLKPCAGRALLRDSACGSGVAAWCPARPRTTNSSVKPNDGFICWIKKLQPMLEEARQGKRTVLFVDAAHFVMGAFLGMLWSFVRQLLPSSGGHQRYNVLGAYDPIRHEVVTLTNDTVVNQATFCGLLDKIASGYAATGLPITLVLDNAHTRKMQSVFDKAEALGIELLYLPAYSPNLNLIERLWRFVKKQVLYSRHYDKFAAFKDSIDNCLRDLGTRFKSNMQTLMTLEFPTVLKN